VKALLSGFRNGWRESRAPEGLFLFSVMFGAVAAAIALVILQFA